MNEQGDVTEETLHIHVFSDQSVLEVFVNSRTVISTRIYHPSNRLYGIRYFADSSGGLDDKVTTLVQADVWDGLGRAN